ncbi:hypothetical protein MPSEU_000916600 [Mayamaea pseudoterrestris]|nr:hypothetical protein MPSEU_000916600 [Mayamaea pseudoterrestris]
MRNFNLALLTLSWSACVSGYNHRHVPATTSSIGFTADPTTTTRRNLFQQAFAVAGSASTAALLTRSSYPAFAAATAADVSTLLYNDATHGFSMQVPADWVQSTQRLPDRRQMQVWKDPSDDQTILFIAYTPVRDDFTSLASFGSVDVVAEQTILPKGELAGIEGGVTSRLITAKSEKQAYFFDYTQAVPGVMEETHYRTIFSLAQGATGGAGAVLVTATLQTPETRYSKLQPLIEQVIQSYGKSKA